MSTEITLFDALNALKWLPENAAEAEIKKAELEVLAAGKRATPEELEKAKKEYTEYNYLLNDQINFNQNITSVLKALSSRTKKGKKEDGGGGSSGAAPR